MTLFDTETQELVGEHQAPGTVTWLAFDPQGDSLASSRRTPAATGTWRFSTRPPGGCAARSRLALPPAPGRAYIAIGDLRSGRTKLDRRPTRRPRSAPCSCVGTTPARGSPLGQAVRVARSVPVPASRGMTPDGRLLVAADRGDYALDAETLRVVRRYPVRACSAARQPRRAHARARRRRTGAFACSTSPPGGCGR